MRFPQFSDDADKCLTVMALRKQMSAELVGSLRQTQNDNRAKKNILEMT